MVLEVINAIYSIFFCTVVENQTLCFSTSQAEAPDSLTWLMAAVFRSTAQSFASGVHSQP